MKLHGMRISVLLVTVAASCLFSGCTTSQPLPPTRKELAMFEAVRDPHCKDISSVLKKPMRINLHDKHGRTPLEYAVYYEDTAKMKALLDFGANPNFIDGKGSSAVHGAATIYSTEPLKLLLANGADPNLRGKLKKTPLMEAVRTGKTENVLLLLDSGAGIDDEDQLKRRPLSFAAMAKDNSLELTKLLLNKGADKLFIDEEGRHPLFQAIDIGNNDTALFYLDMLPDFNLNKPTDAVGLIAMKHAVYAENAVIVKKIAEKKLPLNRDTSKLYRAMKIANIEGFHQLLGRNNILLDDGKRPLFWAAEIDSEPMIELLLSLGAKTNVIDNAGNRPADYARKYHTIRLLKNHN